MNYPYPGKMPSPELKPSFIGVNNLRAGDRTREQVTGAIRTTHPVITGINCPLTTADAKKTIGKFSRNGPPGKIHEQVIPVTAIR